MDLDASKFSLLHSLRTGNIIYDTIISLFIAYIFTVLSKTSSILDLIGTIKFSNKTNKITMECTQSYVWGGRNTLDSSETYKSILYYIKKNNSLSHGLRELCEYHTTEYDEEEEKNDKTKNEIREINYLINQKNEFTINNVLTKDIRFSIVKRELKSNNDDDRQKPICKYILTISSTKLTLSKLQDAIEQIATGYHREMNDKLNKNKYIFNYLGTDGKGRVKYTSYPFLTTCNLERIYFDDKEKIMNQINFFIDNKKWYEVRGKPYTLGICTHGPPGCGKTSFEKALAHKLNRHIIIVDISRIKTQREADEIFFSERINDKHIPYENRLYIFPDIDRMTDILHKNNEPKKEHDIFKQIPKIGGEKPHPVKMDTNNSVDAPLNLSKLLNILDGIPERTGQIIIMSTNHPDKLDEALLRPGRVDCMIEFRKCSLETLYKLVGNFFVIKLTKTQKGRINKNNHRRYSPAEVFKLCSGLHDLDKVIEHLA
jgi:ATP-dependent 26S proteasome regulatory subunit